MPNDFGDFLEGNPQLGGERDHAERVADIVLARDIQGGVAELFVAALHAEGRGEILQLKPGRAIMRLLAETIGNRPG